MIYFNKKTDLISIIAPASTCSNAADKLNKAADILRQQGFNLLVDYEMFRQCELPFFAAPTDVRLQKFKEALLNPSVKIIWCFRGGYGCSDFIFDAIDLIPACHKILVGFSDITSMHALFNSAYGFESLHASVLTTLLPPLEQDINEIIKVLSGKDTILDLTPITESAANLKHTIISGETIGGNLTVFCTLVGTKLHPQTQDKILIIEDVGEVSYKIYRDLMHLKSANILDQLSAVIFADFTSSDDLLETTIQYFCNHHIAHVPAYRTKGIGHETVNHPIIMKRNATIENNQFKLTSDFRLIEGD